MSRSQRQELPSLATHIKKTPLTTLIFDECELEQESLKSILRTPAGLKNLTLGENVFNIYGSKRTIPKLSRKPRASLDVLSVVSHSLESLIHFDPAWRLGTFSQLASRLRPHGEGLRNFHFLKYLECDTSSFLHRTLTANPGLAPPNLETLRLRRHWKAPIHWMEDHPSPDCYLALPSLSTLELLQVSFLLDDGTGADYICDPENVQLRHAIAYKLWKAGINLKLMVEMYQRENIIPPFLHGEPVPITRCFYDAYKIGFHRHVDNQMNLDKDIDGKSEVESNSLAGK